MFEDDLKEREMGGWKMAPEQHNVSATMDFRLTTTPAVEITDYAICTAHGLFLKTYIHPYGPHALP